MVVNIKNQDENKVYIEEIKNRILNLKDRVEIMSDKEKKDKNVNETLEII